MSDLVTGFLSKFWIAPPIITIAAGMFAGVQVDEHTTTPIGWLVTGVISTASMVLWVGTRLQKFQDSISSIEKLEARIAQLESERLAELRARARK